MLPDIRFIIGAGMATVMLLIAGFGMVAAVQIAHLARRTPLEAARALAFTGPADVNRFRPPRSIGHLGSGAPDDPFANLRVGAAPLAVASPGNTAPPAEQRSAGIAPEIAPVSSNAVTVAPPAAGPSAEPGPEPPAMPEIAALPPAPPNATIAPVAALETVRSAHAQPAPTVAPVEPTASAPGLVAPALQTEHVSDTRNIAPAALAVAPPAPKVPAAKAATSEASAGEATTASVTPAESDAADPKAAPAQKAMPKAVPAKKAKAKRRMHRRVVRSRARTRRARTVVQQPNGWTGYPVQSGNNNWNNGWNNNFWTNN
jgi:hypothetical protein